MDDFEPGTGSAGLQHRRTATDFPPPLDTIVPSLAEESTIRPNPSAPMLKPFYTVVSDVNPSSSSSDTYYPRVRYVFSDDDPDIISGTLLSGHAPQSRDGKLEHGRFSSVPLAGNGWHNRSILIDLAPAADGRGYTIAWASSLSPDWAVVGTRLQPLESVSASDVIDDEDARAMVLAIEGLSIPAATLSTSGDPHENRRTHMLQDGRKDSSLRNDRAVPGAKGYDDLVRTFETRMSFLRSAVQNAEVRRRLSAVTEPNQPENN